MILLSSGSLYNYGLNRVFEIASKLGFDGVEIIIDDRYDTRDKLYLKRLEHEFNLSIIAFHVPPERVKFWGDPIKKLKKTIDLAENLEAKVVVCHSSLALDKSFFNWLVKNWSAIQKETKVEIAYENMPKTYSRKRKFKIFKQLVFLTWQVEKFSVFDKICLDTSHLATANLDIIETYKKLKKKIVHIHLSDSNFKPLKGRGIKDEHQLLGKGKLPLGKFLTLLKKTDYKGALTLEFEPENLKPEKEENVIKSLKNSLEFVKKYFK